MKKNYQLSWKSNLLISVLFLFIFVLVLETTIRAYDMLHGRGFFSVNRNLLSKSINPIRPFRTFGSELYKNENGVKYISSCHGELFTIKKPNGTFRIVVFGGSTTENDYSFEEAGIHYPLILQSELRESLGTKAIEVINVGNGAYATPHSLILFELDVLEWEPDMIIVSHNINDLLAAYWPKFTFDYSNKYGHEYYSIPEYKSIFTFSNALFQHSQLYWVIRGRIGKLTSNESRELRRKSYGIEPPQLASKIFIRNLRTFVAVAKENGIRVLLGNQPLQPSEEYFIAHMGYKPYNSIVTYPLHNEFVNHHRTFNKAIKQVAEETRVLFIDNESKLGGNKEYFIDFIHYTPKGVSILANNYTKFLINKNIIPKSYK
jgi:hypothetical protein